MLLLPAWYMILKELDLPPTLIPQDISTQWNSSCDLMGFAVEYHEAIDRIAGDWKFDLRNYEMSEDEWEITDNLHSMLQVSQNGLCNMVHTYHWWWMWPHPLWIQQFAQHFVLVSLL